MAEPYSGPELADLRQNLADLVREGVAPYNVAEKGGELLELAIVTSRLQLDDDADDEDERDAAYAEALVSVLKEAVARKTSSNKHCIASRKHRRILKYVLPLKQEYLGKSIKERRTAAGEDLKEHKKSITPGTIRTYYEPRALEELARVLVEMETEYRSETLPDAKSSADQGPNT